MRTLRGKGMSTPELKQFADLGQSDFDGHPVWIGCHTADYDEPWYDDIDEETFRPWNGPPGPGPSDGMLLVRATLELADGTRFPGFVTPAFDDGDLGIQQPQIFVGGQRYGFWGGRAGVSLAKRQAFYAALEVPRGGLPAAVRCRGRLGDRFRHWRSSRVLPDRRRRS